MALIITIVVVQVLRYLHINLDDKYILYKYAQNLANGYGFCFNIGQRVEGFTSFLFVLLLSAIIKTFNLLDQADGTLITITAIARFICFISTIGTLLYLFCFIKRYFKFSFMPVAISLVLLTLRSDFIFSSVNGLETGLFIFLFTGFTVHLLLSDLTGNKMHRNMFMLFGLLTSLCRADGFIYIGVIISVRFILFCIIYKPDCETLRRHVLSSVAVMFLAIVPYFTFRIWYFHDIFPNTYYVKVHSLFDKIISFNDPSPRLIEGWERLPIVFITYIWPCLGFVFAASFCYVTAIYVITRTGLKIKSELNRYQSFFITYKNEFFSDKIMIHGILIISISTLVFVAYTMYIGGDWMPGYRITIHYFPLPYMMVCSIIVDLIIKLTTRIKDDLMVGFTIIFAFSFFYIQDTVRVDMHMMNSTRVVCKYGSSYALPENHGFYFFQNQKTIIHNFLLYNDFVIKLKSEMKKGDCIALYEIGCTSFQLGTDYHIIDLSALNDRFLSHMDSNEGYYSMCHSFIFDVSNEIRGAKDRYLLSQKPLYIIFDTFMTIKTEALSHILANNYELVNNFTSNNENFFTIYRRIN